MVYAYCRISNKKQNIERQVRNIESIYPGAHIIKEAYTGTTTQRPEWSKLFNMVRTGDTIVFDSVSRMSRSAEDGFSLYEELYNRGVTLIFLKEPHINTDTYKKAAEIGVQLTGTNVDYILEGVNKYMLALAKEQIQLAFDQAEKEVNDLHQRTKEGLVTAKLNGKKLGRPEGKYVTRRSISAKKSILQWSKEFDGSMTDKDCIEALHLGRGTFYKYKSELKYAREHGLPEIPKLASEQKQE